MSGRRRCALAASVLALTAVAGCGGGSSSDVRSTAPTTAVPSSPTSTVATPSAVATTPAPVTTTPPPVTTPPPKRSTVPATTANAAPSTSPVIVVDPGHSPQITSTDPATGLDDSTYENDPEMADVYAVSVLVAQRLRADGYTVVLTKDGVDDRVSLGQRAAVANRLHAALALSVHDQAGASGGIGFASGNNIVYTQSVGGYRLTPAGRKVTFTNTAVATASQRCGALFQARRAAAEGHPVRLMGDTGYDQGTRGHPGGDMWMVQLLSTVPWIYNEAGGNSAGQVGLSAPDQQRYAAGLVAGVEACVPR